jgi:hypothetical protein
MTAARANLRHGLRRSRRPVHYRGELFMQTSGQDGAGPAVFNAEGAK